jgi:hypothetical protein
LLCHSVEPVYQLHPTGDLLLFLTDSLPHLFRTDPGNDSRYVKYVQDMPISWFESFIRSLAHGQIELHRALPKAESLKDCKCSRVWTYMRLCTWLRALWLLRVVG